LKRPTTASSTTEPAVAAKKPPSQLTRPLMGLARSGGEN
jgi:hypothetical protein